MLLPEIYMVEAVGLKNYNYTYKITFFEYVKFGSISWKIDIMPITAYLFFFFCTHVTHVTTQQILFLPNRFSVKYIYPVPIFQIFSAKSPSVTQRLFIQENAFNMSKHPPPFLRKTLSSNDSFILIENNFKFLR